MTKYEYDVRLFTWDGNLDAIDQLNAMGEKGWQLVDFAKHAYVPGQKRQASITLMREVVE